MIITKERLDVFIAQAEQQRAQLLAQVNACEGAIHMMQQLKGVLEQPEPAEEKAGPVLVPDKTD